MIRIKQTEAFLKKTFEDSAYFKEHEAEKNYRIEHSYRVANIAGEIARKEGLDEEGLVIAGLLHDIAYCERFENENDWMNHGRKSAQIARPFLEKLGIEEERVTEICYGIAIHVDDKADFPGRKTPFTRSVGDADNIDRFDAYRIYEGLQYEKFSERSMEEKKAYLAARLKNAQDFREIEFGTETAKKLWISRLDFQKEYYSKLAAQLENSASIITTHQFNHV